MSEAPPPNGRLHDPNLREITADLDGHRALVASQIQALRDLIGERDRLYGERAAAAKVLIDAEAEARHQALVLKSSETEAHLKALNGEAERLRTMQATYLPRETADQRDKEYAKEIGALKDFQTRIESRLVAQGEGGKYTQWLVGAFIATAAMLGQWAAGYIRTKP